jgi:hypothetical protein
MTVRQGYEAQLLYGVAGSTASTVVDNATDIDFDVAPDKASTRVRGDGTSIPIHTEDVIGLVVTATWKMLDDDADATLTALIAAAKAGSAVALAYKRVDAESAEYDADYVLSMKPNKPLTGDATIDFTATPTRRGGRSPVL